MLADAEIFVQSPRMLSPHLIFKLFFQDSQNVQQYFLGFREVQEQNKSENIKLAALEFLYVKGRFELASTLLDIKKC